MWDGLAGCGAILDGDVEGGGGVEACEGWGQGADGAEEVGGLGLGEVGEAGGWRWRWRWRIRSGIRGERRVFGGRKRRGSTLRLLRLVDRADQDVAWEEWFEVHERKSVGARMEDLWR